MSAVTASLCWTPLFFSVFMFVSADQKNITAESGQDVTLTCRAPNNNITGVKWSRADLGTDYVFLYRDDHFVPNNQYFKDRVDLQDRQMKDGDVSLILKNVTINDTGTYECHVVTSGSGRRKRDVNTVHTTKIKLSVVDPPGQPGGDTKDGLKKEDRLILGLTIPIVFLLAFVPPIGFAIYHKKQSRGSNERSADEQSKQPLQTYDHPS